MANIATSFGKVKPFDIFYKLMDKTEYKQTLAKYLPIESLDLVIELQNKYNAKFRISRPRLTKLGDYRSPTNGLGHRISVNGDLNRYSFLLTTLHEYAHLMVWEIHRNSVEPHGLEWQRTYKELLKIHIKNNSFPKDVSSVVVSCFFTKKHTSSSSCEQLYDVLRTYSTEPPSLRVKDIGNDVVFTLKNGKKFSKIEKLRKRFKCREVKSGRLYLVHPLAEIIMIE